MQIKTAGRYHFTLVRMAIINKPKRSVGKDVENLHALLVGMLIGVATVENSMELPQQLKMELLSYDPAITSGIISEEGGTLIQKNEEGGTP